MSLINLYGLYTSLLQSWIELILHKCMGHMFDWGSFLPNHQPSPQSNSELASTRSWEWSGPSPQIDSAWKQPQTNELYIYIGELFCSNLQHIYIYMHMYTYIHNVYIVIYIYMHSVKANWENPWQERYLWEPGLWALEALQLEEELVQLTGIPKPIHSLYIWRDT